MAHNVADIWELYRCLSSDLERSDLAERTCAERTDQICPTCHGGSLINMEGVYCCRACGREQEQIIKCSNRSLVQEISVIDSYFAESQMATNISWKEGFGSLQRTHQWGSVNSTERRIKARLREIETICRARNISGAIIDGALNYYKKYLDREIQLETKTSRGANNTGIPPACIYYAFIDAGINRSIWEIAEIFDLNQSVVIRGINIIHNLLGSELNLDGRTTNYHDYINRFCSNLGLSRKMTEKVMEIADKGHILKLDDAHQPVSYVAGCIFFVATVYTIGLSKEAIARQCNGICVSSVTKAYDHLISLMEDLLD